MARLNEDQIYARFLVEAKEEDGNFYFVKLFDEELFERLCKIERNAVINLDNSGSELRNALEFFLKKALPTHYRSEVQAQNAQRNNRISSHSIDLIDYQKFFEKHRELGVDPNLVNNLREIGNRFHHEGRMGNKALPPKTYATLCNGLRDMQKLLLGYYNKKDPARLKGNVPKAYSKEKQPYGDKMVCSVIETLDSTACEKQILCSRQDNRMQDRKNYYLLRVYSAGNATEGAIRDEKVLSNLWGNNLRGIPNIVRYSPLQVEYNGEDPRNEKKYIVMYDFGAFKPYPLHTKLLEELNDVQKLMIMHDIAAGIQVLHKLGIYHRNLQPKSVFVFFDRNSDFVQAKIVGFEYAKIEADNATVFGNVAKLQQEDPSAFFSASMKQGLKNRQIGERLDWAKEDIYSLGALIYFILTGAPPKGSFTLGTLEPDVDDALKQMLGAMLSPNIMARPDIETVMSYFDEKYQAIT